MLRKLKFQDTDIWSGPSSQTTTTWPLVVRSEQEELINGYVSLDGGEFTIGPVRERSWDEVVEEVLRDRAELWRRLADL